MRGRSWPVAAAIPGPRPRSPGAVAALLDKAEGGPAGLKPSKKDQRVAGRTRAVAEDTRPEAAVQPAEPTGQPPQAEDDEDTGPVAKVIPLGIFDPFAEAKKRW
jgi:hypothetical protein